VRGATRWGGETDNESVRALLGEALIAEGARAAAALGVRLAGVDIITTDPGWGYGRVAASSTR